MDAEDHTNIIIGADFDDAWLMNGNLNGATLVDAELNDTNLMGANLIDADLTGTELEEAIFCQTVMPDGSVATDDCE
ncbi:MAG: pentapeptide repeat-containing protein [Cyanobacteria bacterium P01_F01_bin.150]